MRCPQCQHENPEHAKFCLECGTRLALTCSQCSTELPPNAQFCLECGHPAAARPTAPAAPPTSLYTSPQTYTPQHLAERILTSRGALEGERKQVTVLFADLKGSMELLADRDPEEARGILDPVLERMMEAVHRYEGTVNQVMGDGIMALFGAPLAHEDHAVRACYAALRMQAAVKQYAEEVRRATGVLVQIRVGLNSGEVVVRSISSDLRMDYTAVGQTTHLAARMEQMAAPGSVLLTPETLRLVEGYVQVKSLGPLPVKGLDAPVEVYEVVGAGATRTRLQAAVTRGLTRFVGRETELETLRQTLERASAGHGQIIALVGDPGVGKSRLTWEFTHSHRIPDWLVLESCSVSYGKATPWLPVSDLLRTYLRVEGADDARRIRQTALGKVLDLDRTLESSLPALLSLLDVATEDPAWDALDPPQRRQSILDAAKRLLLRESQEQPLLLVLEDLHWIDAETQALLDSLVESLPTARVLLLVNYRPEYEHSWHRKTYYREARLDPLGPESADALLQALLGDDERFQPLKRLLIDRTEGNPFFLEESVRTLVETGTLAGERGAYVLARPAEPTQVPATVQAVLAARIDRLLPEDKRLLQAAAVVGKDVPYPLLQAVAELPEDRLRHGLARLQDTEFLYETSLFPDLEYTFKHALTHEVTYASLLHERRRALHARIVAAAQSLYGGRLTDQVERLAHHAVRGEVWDQAVAYLRQAGGRAISRAAFPEAVAHFEQALVALGHLPENHRTRAQAIDLRFDLRGALQPLNQHGRVLDYLREAEALAETLGDQQRLARVACYLAQLRSSEGDHQGAVKSGQRALTLAADLQDLATTLLARLFLGRAYLALGDYVTAMEHVTADIVTLQGDLLRERFGQPGMPSVACREVLAECHAQRGEFSEAQARAEEAVQIAEAAGQPFSRSLAYRAAGSMFLLRGNPDQAIAVLERALTLGGIGPIPLHFPGVASALGYAYALAGRFTEALPLLEQAAEHSSSGGMSLHSQRVTWLSETYLLAGRRQDAAGQAGRALALAHDHMQRSSEADALRLLGEIAAHADPPDFEQAESYYRQALSLAEELGMRPLAAHCHLSLGTLYQNIGRQEQAQTELGTATEMYRAMDMAFWLAKAEAILAQVSSI
jgi:class 3 adenylate cyclase/tetratricopeptide (TPR) repeat protein